MQLLGFPRQFDYQNNQKRTLHKTTRGTKKIMTLQIEYSDIINGTIEPEVRRKIRSCKN